MTTHEQLKNLAAAYGHKAKEPEPEPEPPKPQQVLLVDGNKLQAERAALRASREAAEKLEAREYRRREIERDLERIKNQREMGFAEKIAEGIRVVSILKTMKTLWKD